MGTNYYTDANECKHCNRKERLHIGKKSMGWEFNFQAYDFYPNSDGETPISPMLNSWKNWKEFLEDKKILDEYGEEVSYQEFVGIVEKSKGKDNKNHFDYCLNDPKHREHTLREIEEDQMWKDEDGWAFGYGDFAQIDILQKI